MNHNPLPNRHAEEQRFQAERPAPASSGLYADLCAVEALKQAYTHVQENAGELGIDPLTFETLEAEGVETFLHQLSRDLHARTYHPARGAEREGRAALRDLVVQVALKRLLESEFPPAFTSDPDPEKTIQWLAGNIDKELCRVHALHLNESLDAGGCPRLLECVTRRIGDPQLIALLKEVLAASMQPDHPSQGLLAPVLIDIAFAGIDHILQQAKALGREGNFLHVQCTRVGNQLVVLADRDVRYDWILPAVKKRLREELTSLHYDSTAIDTQALDLTCGHRLRFLGYELRLVRGRHGESKVRYRLVDKAKRRQAQNATADRPLFGGHLLRRLLQPCVKWLERWRSFRFFFGLCRKADAIQVGWLHLPITQLPVLMVVFGWRSLPALICLALIFVCNWRWILYGVEAVCRKANSIQASWSYLPITVFPIVGSLYGWRSPLAWLDLALILACNWRWSWGFVRWSGRHKLDAVVGVCALSALIFLYPFVSDIYAHRPREVAAASPSLPRGFYLGEYHGDSWWMGETTPTVSYGLYVPPQFQGKKGPFPLIVFLHGYGERTKNRIFKAGLPLAIAQRFGTNKPNGHFQFVAFFPIDPSGGWQAGSAEVEGVMKALDYVMRRHHIDASRVYLTGLSAGGSGVWNLAEAYPDKWAAVVPVCSFISPVVQNVRHIPAWIYHGAKDKQAPVERERWLVRQLKEAGADVRYTEFPKKGHGIWGEVYNPKALYKWLASKRKGG